MKQPSREEYQRAVALAREAIRARKARPRIRADRSPQAALAKMQAKQAKGEPLTEADLGAMAAALAEQDNRKRRGRGRPKGARDDAAHGALRAAIIAMGATRLRPYRNGETGPRLSQCDAIADAMKAEGFRTLCSYDAAKREMLKLRKAIRGTFNRDALALVARRMQAMAQDVSRAGKALVERLRAQSTLPPETLQRIKKALQTTR